MAHGLAVGTDGPNIRSGRPGCLEQLPYNCGVVKREAMGRFGRTTQFIGSGLVQVQQLGAQRRIEAFRVMRNHAAASVELA